MRLINCNGTLISSTTTDSNGNYSFTNLKAANYQVVFDVSTNTNNINDYLTAPQGITSAINPITNTSACISFNPDQGAIIDAGFYRPTGAIEGTVFNDLDGDGMQEAGELGIEGMTVNLLNCTGTVIASTVTDFNGNYSFGNLNTGNYQVAFIPTTNVNNITDFLTSPPNRGDDTMDSDINSATNTSDCLAFDPLLGADIDAGFLQPKGEIVGTIFNDKNEDGMQGAGEIGITGVTVVLLNDTGNPIATTFTDSNGNYSFTDILTGNYQILIDKDTNTSTSTDANSVDNFVITEQDMGDDEFDSDINPVDSRSDIFVFTPADGADIDGGLFQLSLIHI